MTTDFNELDLSSELMSALTDLEFTKPTEIQAQAIPYLLENDNDFIGVAQTGTGKTAAFLIPLLEKIQANSNATRSIILAPTRELAQQIDKQLKALSKYKNIKSTCVYGGAPIQNQIRVLKKNPEIVVGTPGRVLDLMKRKVLKLSDCEYFVLDEADEMLNMGFWDDIQVIFSSIKNLKQTLMFSATLPKLILKHIEKNFHPEFKKIEIEKKSLSNSNVKQKYYIVKNNFFKDALLRMIEATPDMYGIIFCRTRIETKDVADFLRDNNHNIEILNGDMGQKERDRAMDKFKAKRVNLMVCTDVAARGIDVSNLTHVINFGIPQDNETYVHRIGRTGRAGSSGIAATISCPKTAFVVKKIERFTRAPITLESLPKLDTLKKNKMDQEISKISSLVEDQTEVEELFGEDKSYQMLEDRLKECTREQILKVFFQSHFQEKLLQYDSNKNIEVKPGQVDLAVHGRSSKRRGGGGGRGSRGRGRGPRRRSGGGGGERRSASDRGEGGGERRSSRGGSGESSGGERRSAGGRGGKSGGRSSGPRRRSSNR